MAEKRERSAKQLAQDKINLSHTLTKEEQRKGGKASAAARRKRKLMRETLDSLLSLPVDSGKLEDVEIVQSLAEAKGMNLNVQETIMIQMLLKVLEERDVNALKLLWEMSGEKNSTDDTDNDAVLQFIRNIAE